MKNKDIQFYEINKDLDLPLGEYGDLIRLNREDMEFTMYVDKCVGIPKKEDLLELKTSNFDVFTCDDYIDEDKFKEYYAVVYLAEAEDIYDLIKDNWGDIEDSTITEAGYTRDEIIKTLKDNIIDDFDYDLITLPYWDGSNWQRLYIYDNFYNCHVYAAADGSSCLEEPDESDLNKLEEIEYYHGNTYNNILYRSPNGEYYLKEDSFWEGNYSNIFDIYTKVEESELPEILKEKFGYSQQEIDNFFQREVAITE